MIEVPHRWDGATESLAATIHTIRSDSIPNPPKVDPISTSIPLLTDNIKDSEAVQERIPNWTKSASHHQVFKMLAKSLNLQNPMDWYNVDKETLDNQTGFRTILETYYGNSLYKVPIFVLAFPSSSKFNRLSSKSSQILISFLGDFRRTFQETSGWIQQLIGRLLFRLTNTACSSIG